MLQFKLTLESDGVWPAIKGLALFNPYSMIVKAHWTYISDLIHKNLPTVGYFIFFCVSDIHTHFFFVT